MRMQPAFFEVVEPFRILVAVGCSEGNTWIGSSRVIETRYNALNAQPGSIVHSLPGGTFLTDTDGVLHEARLRTPKPILEKTYGLPRTNDQRFDEMAASGIVRPVGRPQAADYRAARERGSVRLPPLRGGVFAAEESDELVRLKVDLETIANAFANDGATVGFEDIGQDDHVRMTVRYPGEAVAAGIARSATTRALWAHGQVPGHSVLADAWGRVASKGAMTHEAFEAIDEAAVQAAGVRPST